MWNVLSCRVVEIKKCSDGFEGQGSSRLGIDCSFIETFEKTLHPPSEAGSDGTKRGDVPASSRRMEPEGDKGQGYQHREAEPKDYDIDAIPRGQQKNLHSSTYKRLSNLNDGEWTTTTESFMSQINLKDDYRLREKKPIMDMKDTMKEFFERTSGCPETNHYNVIPRHHPDHFKMCLETTYTYDFPPPYNTPSYEEVPEKIVDYRKCHSQFVDTDDYRHWGRNTWLDESGVYPNSELKRILFPPSNPIPTRLV